MDAHEEFKKALKASEGPRWAVARWIGEKHGFEVVMPAMRVAPTHKEWNQYADDGDIIVKRGGAPDCRVEVKRLRIPFTGAADWPYGDTMIVCAKHSYDRAEPKPDVYVICNKTMTRAALIFPRHTFHLWTADIRQDRRPGRTPQTFYLCPTSAVSFREIPSSCLGVDT